MNKNSVTITIALTGIALLGLITIQVYWVKNAMKLIEQRFDLNVNEALSKVVVKMEKQKAAAKITKRFNFHKQGISIISSPDSIVKKSKPAINKKNKVNVRVLEEEYSSNSNGIVVKRSQRKDYSSDSSSSEIRLRAELDVPAYIQDFDMKQFHNKLTSERENMVNDIFDELVSINIYNDYNYKVDSLLLDSVLHAELLEKGIKTDYTFEIANSSQVKNDSPPLRNNELLLQTVHYKVNLSPQNIFIKPQYLIVQFPHQQRYLLRSLLLMLLISVAFISVVIFLFYYTITTIIKQKKLSEIKNDFVSNMTHEFKTPISTISLACEVLSDTSVEKSPERVSNFVKMISDENKRLSVLVENILQTAILEKGKFKLQIQSINVHTIIEQVIANTRLQVENKEGEIVAGLSAKNPVINADRLHVTNIIFNLVDNALKYTTQKPVIKISTRNDDRGVFISIGDNGIGISRENQKRVFDTMYRVSTGNVHNIKGFGLGLSYVKTIVEKHGGMVNVDSVLGVGSTFTIYLPFDAKT